MAHTSEWHSISLNRFPVFPISRRLGPQHLNPWPKCGHARQAVSLISLSCPLQGKISNHTLACDLYSSGRKKRKISLWVYTGLEYLNLCTMSTLVLLLVSVKNPNPPLSCFLFCKQSVFLSRSPLNNRH